MLAVPLRRGPTGSAPSPCTMHAHCAQPRSAPRLYTRFSHVSAQFTHRAGRRRPHSLDLSLNKSAHDCTGAESLNATEGSIEVVTTDGSCEVTATPPVVTGFRRWKQAMVVLVAVTSYPATRVVR